MGKHLQYDLADLQSAILNEAKLVEQMVRSATAGLQQRKPDAVAGVLAIESVLNQAEVQVEERCVEFIAIHQPVAVDLRRITAMLRINGRLERVGDLAMNLAERAESLSKCAEVSYPPMLKTMGEHAIEMLSDAFQAFIDEDADLAREVCQRDDQVDLMNEHVIRTLVRLFGENAELAESYLHVFSASRIIERIADHATNVAEDVSFVVSGEIARHREQCDSLSS